jgi:hypothetical protein
LGIPAEGERKDGEEEHEEEEELEQAPNIHQQHHPTTQSRFHWQTFQLHWQLADRELLKLLHIYYRAKRNYTLDVVQTICMLSA